ncbi:MAG: hypothetical protein WBA41_14775 [Rivularia sp. (in: cyanobacteria)]
MFKHALAQPYFLSLGIAAVLVGAVTAPASAQSVIIINGNTPYYGGNQNPTVGNFIYGSPIPTPVPVNPATGHTPTPRYFSQPYPSRKYNSILVNPVLVNPRIYKDSRNRRYYRNSRQRYYRQPASRIIINSPW